MPGDIWLTFPDGKEHELKESVTIGRRGPGQLQRHVPERDPGTTGNASPAAARRPHRNRRGDSPLLLAGSAAGSGHDRAARGGRAHRFRAALLVPAPGRAVPVRAVARRRQSREPAIERADRRPTRDAGSNGNRQSSATPHLRKGRALGSARTREASRTLSRRTPARLGLEKRRGSTRLPRDPSVRTPKAKPAC